MADCSCGCCGSPDGLLCYRSIRLCAPCKRLAVSWCWRKLQGLEREDILPRYDLDSPGMAYLCTLCGYWHWTSNQGEPSEDTKQVIRLMTRYFETVNFHINVARGWARIRYAETVVPD